ncbi:MAG TPA: 16S rRNA (adenine(1518)-N(6)/adenine(1519)-N(6))-dimethyltransferase RsmA [Polyangiaceae bacterium]|jgi:16S rRNA (adenine1518-N6/adenine1519-N6)-dimethyltransferase|nr:16S rRNA (adenine(1518)-N(6)/adenine(1519)-N(6))-dimethyltransferase RsmA [Polyangiaceae bacterium]
MAEALSPRLLLEHYGLRPKHPFGQNFLSDAGIARQIAELATTPPGGTVIEIGAGLGALTRPLLDRAARVVAIERDRELVPALADEFREAIDEKRLELVEADAKQFDYASLLDGATGPKTIAGNLPYQLTGPLLRLTVELAPRFDRAVYMVQLEVAARLTAKASEEDYGALTVFVNAALEVERKLVVRRGAFYPQPNVDSAVVLLRPRAEPLSLETTEFRAVVKAAFSQRRKTLRNAWRGLPNVTPEQLKLAAERANVDLDARGETLDTAAFARMASELSVVPS